MDKPGIERAGDSWVLTWQAERIGLGMERLRESSDGLHAEIVVQSIRPGGPGRLLGPVRLNILSAESQTRLANTLDKRVNGPDAGVNWHAVVVQACAMVAAAYRTPAPTIRIRDYPNDGPVEYLVERLIPMGETTLLYGDGESAKSLLAQRISLSCATGARLPWGGEPVDLTNVLYLDWETNVRVVKQRMLRMAFAAGLEELPDNIHYRGDDNTGHILRSLEDELPNLRAEIARLEIGLVVVDSIGFACSGPLVEDQTARSVLNALRQLAPATRLVVAHVSSDTARQTTGKARPFGSTFFWNGMRSGIEVRRSEESAATRMDLGLYHRKANDGEHHPDIGLSVYFDQVEGAPIRFARSNISEVPDLAARASLSARITSALRVGSLDTKELAKQADAPESSVRKTLERMANVTLLVPGGGRGKPSIWGLKSESS